MFKFALIGILFFSSSLYAAKPVSQRSKAKSLRSAKGVPAFPENQSGTTVLLLSEYRKNLSNPEIKKLKAKTMSLGGKSVPALIKVMKSEKFPEKSRWIATFLLGKIMGKKASPFISKFVTHDNWFMRMASLKTLLALRETKYSTLYGKALEDKSYLVRSQALENIRVLNLKSQAPRVWAMLYNKQNYYGPSKKKANDKKLKRANIIRDVVKTIGDLKFQKAKDPLFKMVQKKKYKDIFAEIDYALGKITQKESPEGNIAVKKRYWQRMALSQTKF